jgi:hypothetical protein
VTKFPALKNIFKKHKGRKFGENFLNKKVCINPVLEAYVKKNSALSLLFVNPGG